MMEAQIDTTITKQDVFDWQESFLKQFMELERYKPQFKIEKTVISPVDEQFDCLPTDLPAEEVRVFKTPPKQIEERKTAENETVKEQEITEKAEKSSPSKIKKKAKKSLKSPKKGRNKFAKEETKNKAEIKIAKEDVKNKTE